MAVISHVMLDGAEIHVAFAPRTLSSSEKNHTQVEREALSLVFGIKQFISYLYGHHFTMEMDHKLFDSNLWIEEGHTAHGSSSLAEIGLATFCMYDICLTRGFSSVVRYTKNSWPKSISFDLQPFKNRTNKLCVEEGCLLWGARVFVPKKLRSQVLEDLHHGQIGIVCKMKVSGSEINVVAGDPENSCIACAEVKKAPMKFTLHPWVCPSKLWKRIHLDFYKPFMGSMFLVAVDAYSKWPEVEIISQTTTGKTLDVLQCWFASYGVPKHKVRWLYLNKFQNFTLTPQQILLQAQIFLRPKN